MSGLLLPIKLKLFPQVGDLSASVGRCLCHIQRFRSQKKNRHNVRLTPSCCEGPRAVDLAHATDDGPTQDGTVRGLPPLSIPWQNELGRKVQQCALQTQACAQCEGLEAAAGCCPTSPAFVRFQTQGQSFDSASFRILHSSMPGGSAAWLPWSTPAP